MVSGVGIDLFEVERMRRGLAEGGEAFAAQLFTPAEIELCRRQRHPIVSFASCYAAKEAVVKALALDGPLGTAWHLIEVVEHEDGTPAVRLHGEIARRALLAGVHKIDLALASTPSQVAATAIAQAVAPQDR